MPPGVLSGYHERFSVCSALTRWPTTAADAVLELVAVACQIRRWTSLCDGWLLRDLYDGGSSETGIGIDNEPVMLDSGRLPLVRLPARVRGSGDVTRPGVTSIRALSGDPGALGDVDAGRRQIRTVAPGGTVVVSVPIEVDPLLVKQAGRVGQPGETTTATSGTRGASCCGPESGGCGRGGLTSMNSYSHKGVRLPRVRSMLTDGCSWCGPSTAPRMTGPGASTVFWLLRRPGSPSPTR